VRTAGSSGNEPEGDIAAASGVPVRVGFFPDVLAADERFDLIVFNDVLEHLPDVHAALAACAAHLTPGGWLVVNAPCRRGVFYRTARALAKFGRPAAFDRLWQAGFPSPHVHYFDASTLVALAARHGFAAVAATRLPSVRAQGLMARIRTDRSVAAPRAALVAGAVVAALPVLAVLPPDIRVWAFRKDAPA
jgi:SAM-dependent methyltransferase